MPETFFPPAAIRAFPHHSLVVYPPSRPRGMDLGRLRAVCAGVRQVTEELLMMYADRRLTRRDRRRTMCHVRQIAMYVCHVVLRFTQHDIGLAFGRDRSTVSHACHVVEDRRDDPAFDDFVSSLERIAAALFSPVGEAGDE